MCIRDRSGTAAGGPAPVTEEVLAAVAEGRHHDPHSVLGAHPNPDGSVTIRTLGRFATSVAVRTPDGIFPLEHEWGGIFTGVVPAHEKGRIPDYRVEVSYAGKEPELVDDPYRFAPTPVSYTHLDVYKRQTLGSQDFFWLRLRQAQSTDGNHPETVAMPIIKPARGE